MTIEVDEPTILLRSSVLGRNRWEVPCLSGNERWAAAVELVLRGEDGVLEATANPVTGRVLVTYVPGKISAPVEVLLRQALSFGPASAEEYMPPATGLATGVVGSLVSAELGCLLLKLAFAGCPAVGVTAGQPFSL
jgi:hypothetical protein